MLLQASWCVLVLWALLGCIQVHGSCTTTFQGYNTKEVRCHFTPSTSTRSRRPGSSQSSQNPSTVILHRALMAAAPSDTTKMDLSNSEIRDIRLGTFMGMHSLRQLDLSSNKLSSLKVGPFEGLLELTHLNISNNFIKHVGLGTFNANRKLQVLDLTKNMVGKLDWGVFDGMGGLLHLYLAKNNLHSSRLNENVMGSLTGITYLDFSANDMNAAPSTMLQAMGNLGTLIMRKCSLTGIPDYLLRENLKNMKRLELAKNGIKSVNKNAFSVMVNLEILDLSENGLESVNDEVFYPLRQLKKLHLNGNQIVQVPPQMFRHSIMLEEIDLSRNEIKCLNSDFQDNTRLRSISVEYNSLVHLIDSFDKTIQRLQSFYINHNPWNCYSFKHLIKKMNVYKVDYGRHNYDGRTIACKMSSRQYGFCY